MHGEFSSNIEDGSAHLHTSRIVVKMFTYLKNGCVMEVFVIQSES